MKTLQYMQENHVKYPKWCVYWIGPFNPLVFTADMETLKGLLQLPGGINVAWLYVYLHT